MQGFVVSCKLAYQLEMMRAVPREHCKVYLMHGPDHEADIQHAITAPKYAARCNKAGNTPAAALNTAQHSFERHSQHSPKALTDRQIYMCQGRNA